MGNGPITESETGLGVAAFGGAEVFHLLLATLIKLYYVIRAVIDRKDYVISRGLRNPLEIT